MKFPEQHKAAEGDELVAFALERYIREYVPRGWVEPLRVSTSGPMLTAEDVQEFRDLHEQGRLAETLQKRYERNPRIAEAIIDYFEKQEKTS